tara:strand:+ start:231 stop:686 length:456 start_codon:yes stop_codon:yes gene_type:complete
MWFSKVPGYIFNKEKTPYLTKANELTLAQSQYELVAYGVFVGTIYAIIGLAAFLNYIENSSPLYLLWLIGSVAVIHSVFSVIKKYEVIPSYIISLAPAFIVGICFYDGVIESASFLTLTIFVCFFILSLKYGWRVTRIVAWQRYTGEFKLN